MDDHRLAFFSLVLITPTLVVATGLRYLVRRRKDSPRGLRIRVFVGLLISVTFGLKSLARALDGPFFLDMASMALFGGALLVWVIAENRAAQADKEAQIPMG